MDFPGSSFKEISNVSCYEDCDESCKNDNEKKCHSWVWSEHTKQCWLKEIQYDLKKAVKKIDYVSGGQNCKRKSKFLSFSTP